MAKNKWLWMLRRAVGISADPTYYIRSGDAALTRGDFAAARRAYEIAIELDPQCWDAYEKRGTANANLNEFEKAIADFDLDASNADDPTVAYQNRACAYEQMGRSEQALADYARAVERTPNYWPAYYNRALLSARLGDRGRALDDFRRCQEIGLPADELETLRRDLQSRGVIA